MSNTDQIEEITKLMCKFKQEPYEPLPCEKCCYNDTCHYQSIAKDLCEADFVKVVRCKDCEYFYKPHEQSFSCYCTHSQWAEYTDGYGMRVSGADYCSYGERKE